MKIRILLIAAAMAAAGVAHAKLPAPTDEQKAAAEAKAAKAAEAAAKAKEALAAAQDRVAARWIEAKRAEGVTVAPTPLAPKQ